MGSYAADVQNYYLPQHPDQNDMLKPFYLVLMFLMQRKRN